MNQGAAVGVSLGEQCPQHQEAERARPGQAQGSWGPNKGVTKEGDRPALGQDP